MTEPKELSEKEIEKLEAKLEKHIENFSNLFQLLDSKNDGERENALRFLTTRMKQINEVTYQLTGEEGTLNFATLLEKIENSDGNDEQVNQEDLEEIIQINEDLKEAETMLIEEVDRLKTLLQIKKYENVNVPSLNTVLRYLDDRSTKINQLINAVNFMTDESDKVANSSYQYALENEFNKVRDDNGKIKLTISEKVLDKILKKMGYPSFVEGNVKQKALLKAQDLVLQDKSKEFSSHIAELKPFLEDFSEMIKASQYSIHSDNSVLQQVYSQLEQAQNRIDNFIALEADYLNKEAIIEELTNNISNKEKQKIDLLKVIEAEDGATELKKYYQEYLGLNEVDAFSKACEVYASRSMATENTMEQYIALREDFNKVKENFDFNKSNYVRKREYNAILDKNKQLGRDLYSLDDKLNKNTRGLKSARYEAKKASEDKGFYKSVSKFACISLLTLSGLYIGDEISDNQREIELSNKLDNANKSICHYQGLDENQGYSESVQSAKKYQCLEIRRRM